MDRTFQQDCVENDVVPLKESSIPPSRDTLTGEPHLGLLYQHLFHFVFIYLIMLDHLAMLVYKGRFI